jgi:NADH dehydrogenase
VRATRLGQILHEATGVPIDRRGRVRIQPDLTLPNHPEIYAIGDMTYLEEAGQPLPGVAPVAIQQGRHAGRQILNTLAGAPRQPFHYVDRGNMATIGRAAAVADLHFIRLSGFLAWLAWLFIHLIHLIGFRNRLAVLNQWFLNYLTYMRSVRLIVGDSPRMPPPARPATNDNQQVQVARGLPVDGERAVSQQADSLHAR